MNILQRVLVLFLAFSFLLTFGLLPGAAPLPVRAEEGEAADGTGSEEAATGEAETGEAAAGEAETGEAAAGEAEADEAETEASETESPSADPVKLIALSFDDGPSTHTAGLLDGLKELGVVATFFMNGANGAGGASMYPELLARMVAEGHQLANHTNSHHIPFDELSEEEISSEVSIVDEYLFAAMGGAYEPFVRTPGGANSDRIAATVPHPMAYWTVDTRDWESRDTEQIYGHIMNDVSDGAIILMHDSIPMSVEAVLRAIPDLRAQGYEFVTVAELMRRKGNTPLVGDRVVHSDGPTVLPAYSAPAVTQELGAGEDMLVTVTGPDTDLHGLVAKDGTVIFPGFDLKYYYTTDGSVPNLGSAVYSGPVGIPDGAVLTVMGIDRYGTRTPMTQITISNPYKGLFGAKVDPGSVHSAGSKEMSPRIAPEAIVHKNGHGGVVRHLEETNQ